MEKYYDDRGQQLVSQDGDMAILSSEDHVTTLPPIQAALAAASPTGLFAYWHATGAVIPVARVEVPYWII